MVSHGLDVLLREDRRGLHGDLQPAEHGLRDADARVQRGERLQRRPVLPDNHRNRPPGLDLLLGAIGQGVPWRVGHVPEGTFQTCRTDGECGASSDAGALKRCIPQVCTSPTTMAAQVSNTVTIEACAAATSAENDAGTLAFCKPL